MLFQKFQRLARFFAICGLFIGCNRDPSGRELRATLGGTDNAGESENAEGRANGNNADPNNPVITTSTPTPTPTSSPFPTETNNPKDTPPIATFTIKRMGGAFAFTKSIAKDTQGNIFIGGYAYRSFDGNVRIGMYDFL